MSEQCNELKNIKYKSMLLSGSNNNTISVPHATKNSSVKNLNAFLEAEKAHKQYELCRSIRDKVYHMNGRDTLAPGNHEQRWWDQQHDYK